MLEPRSRPLRIGHGYSSSQYFLIPLASHPCSNHQRKSREITSLQKTWGAGVCHSKFPSCPLAFSLLLSANTQPPWLHILPHSFTKKTGVGVPHPSQKSPTSNLGLLNFRW